MGPRGMSFLHKFRAKLEGLLQETETPGSSYFNTQHHFLKTFGLEHLFPYRSFKRGSNLFFNVNSTGFVLETCPLVGSSEEMQRELSGLFHNVLKEGACFQIMIYGDPRIDGILDAWAEPLSKGGDILTLLAQKRKAHFQKLALSGKEVVARTFRVILSYSESGICQTQLEEMGIMQVRQQLISALETLGLSVTIWKADDLLAFLDGLVNFDHSTDPSVLKWNPRDFLNEQIGRAETQWTIDAQGIHLKEGELTVRIYGVLREPDYWSLNAMGSLLGDLHRDMLRIGTPFFIHYGLTVCEQGRMNLLVQGRQDWVEKQSLMKMGRRIPSIKALSKELSFVSEQLEKGERFIKSRLSVTLLSPRPQIEQQEQILKSLFRSNRWELQREKYLQLPLLLSTFPMMWGAGMKEDLHYLKRLKTTLTSEAANLLPLQGEWRGNSTQGMLLCGRRGQLFVWDPFMTPEGNYNVSVVGKSGSGKSVFMQELVTMGLGAGAQVFIIDVGRSFEKLVKLLGGTYIEFTPQSQLCLNPFSTIARRDHVLPQEDLAMLKPLISLMAAPQEGTSDLENSLIEEAIMRAWREKENKAGMDDVIRLLLSKDDSLANGLGKKLFPYTCEGSYGRYFNGPATIDLNQPLLVLELEELKERKDLQSVIVQVMILHITNKLYLGNRTRPTYFVLDEAWDLLRAPQAGLFIETAARRFRKYRGSLVIGTQSVNDFYATPGAQAAFDNSDWLCMLSQKKESIENLKKSHRIVVDPLMEELLYSLKTKSGVYGEVMIRGPYGFAVGRLILDPFSNMLYTTKAEEFASIQERIQGGASLYEALTQEATALEGGLA